MLNDIINVSNLTGYCGETEIEAAQCLMLDGFMKSLLFPLSGFIVQATGKRAFDEDKRVSDSQLVPLQQRNHDMMQI